MPITYDAPSNIITVSGYTEASPCTFEDIYQADVAGGWGVVSKQGSSQYLFDCRFRIYSGYFIDISKQVEFSSIAVSADSQWLVELRSNTVFRGGESVDVTNKICRHGLHIIALDTYNYTKFFSLWKDATLELYGCTLENPVSQRKDITVRMASDVATFTLYSCILSGNILISGLESTWKIHRLTDVGTNQALEYGLIISGVLDDVLVAQKYYAIRVQHAYAATLKNVVLKNNTYAFFVYNISTDKYIVNADIDNWNLYYYGTSTANVFRQYEFDAHCQDKEGNDLNGVSAVGEYVSPYGEAFSETTDGNGDIPTKIVDHGFFDQPHGDTEQLKTPLKVTYSKAGYQTVVKYYSLDKKTEDRVVMHKAVGVFLDFGSPVFNLKKSDPENKNVMVL